MLTLALIGCGGMGRRHLNGLHKLKGIEALPFQLVAVSDVYRENAERAADLAAQVLGERPQVFERVSHMRQALPHVDAAIVATAPDAHAVVGTQALEGGMHVMVEKPIALTVGQGIDLIESAARHDRKLAVAENYRRDPMNRLARALLDAGVLGRVHLAVQSSSGSGERVIITPWRHRRQSGGIVVDMGIHYADLLEYFLGPIEQLFGFNAIVDQQRLDDAGTWHDVDAEDLSVGVTRFESGALGNWVVNLAGRGETHFSRIIYGSNGSLSIPQDRSGSPLSLTLRQNGKDVAVGPSEQLDLVPAFALDDVTATLFGGDRLSSYRLEYADIDANLLAIEQADFAAAILEDRSPEVDGGTGLRALAISYGFLEAERLGHAVDVTSLMANHSSPYQRALVSGDRGGAA
jgi:predicted dehydrogenase